MGLFSAENCRKFFFWTTQVIGITIIILTLVHIYNYRGGFGGRGYPKQEFCWHVFFMTLGFTYISANGLLAFRLLPLMSKQKLKLIHLALNWSVLICGALGLFFVVDERDILGKDHFTSLHSWIGVTALGLLTLQSVSGVIVYLYPYSPPSLKERLMPWHIKTGIVIFLLGTGALITGYKKGTTGEERLLINFTGVSVVLLCFLVLHILTDQSYRFCFRLK